MLALYNAVSDNRAAYNLPFSFIDQFEDDTGITTETTVDRNASEYVSSIIPADTTINLGTEVGGFSYAGAGQVAQTPSGLLDNNWASINSWTSRSTNTTATGVAGDVGEFGSHATFYKGTSWNFGGIMIWSGHDNSYSALGAKDCAVYTSTDTTNGTNGTWTRITPDAFSPSTFAGADLHNRGQRTSQLGSDFFIASSIRNATTRNATQADTIAFTQTSIKGMRLDIRTVWDYNGYYSAEKPHVVELEIYDDGGVSSGITNATGTLISDTQTSSVATTKMSGVILYKDNAGTATLGTHLKIYLSANGGTNWTEVVAADFGAVTPLFSTGVKMVRLAEQTVTSGTTPVMKAVWASQASGTLETQLHGWAMNY
jgi:hypothetical protein